MPCILIESAYERERHTTAQTIRRQAYWALLSGASGEVFGHRDTYPVGTNRNAALNDPGVESMGIFQTFSGTIPWYKMRADWPHSLFITGRGNFNSTQYPAAKITPLLLLPQTVHWLCYTCPLTGKWVSI